jgi:hypothetical protein
MQTNICSTPRVYTIHTSIDAAFWEREKPSGDVDPDGSLRGVQCMRDSFEIDLSHLKIIFL